MKALISTIESRMNGYRVAQVTEDTQTFDVSPDLYWVDCDSSIIADQFWYDPSTQKFIAFPPPVIPAEDRLETTGTQDL
jgi:hypothetical protein